VNPLTVYSSAPRIGAKRPRGLSPARGVLGGPTLAMVRSVAGALAIGTPSVCATAVAPVLNDQDVLQVVPGHLPATLEAGAISAALSGEHVASILTQTIGPGVLATTLPPRCVLDSLANLASFAVVNDGCHLPRSTLLKLRACRVHLDHRELVGRLVELVAPIRRRGRCDESANNPVFIRMLSSAHSLALPVSSNGP